jgi:ZIP family zinc transporter
MNIVLIACAAFCATLAGGLFALKLKDKLHLVLGFSAGAVVAVGFFDLIPEAIELGGARASAFEILSWTALGFFLYLVIDRVQFLHGHPHEHDDHGHHTAHTHGAEKATLRAGSLSAHSFLDGVAIGMAFKASTALGVAVTIAVLAHDFSDGINTTNVVLKSGGSRNQALRWIFADALAPAAGLVVTQLFSVPADSLAIALAVFAGFFLYIGASDLIPESHHAHPKFLTTVMTLLGAGVICIAITIAKG